MKIRRKCIDVAIAKTGPRCSTIVSKCEINKTNAKLL